MAGKPPSALKKDDAIHDNEEPEMSQARREWLRDYVAVSMGIWTIPKVLDEVSFEGIARYIASGKAHNIITMAGAGISTSAGIPDYRSPGTGLYDQLKKEYDVKDPQELNSIDFFKKDPRPFFKRSKLFFKDVFKPTPCHYFIRMLHEKGLLLRHYTQNIDTLERSAGLPEDKLLEAHGSWNASHCLKCGKQYSKQFIKEAVMADQIPTCTEGECAGTIKPDIVLFGEALPRHFAERVEEDFLKCDLLIIMGTSLVVQPFATLPSKVPMQTPRLYVNREKGQTGATHPMTALFFGGGFHFDSKDNVRDVFKEADCDAGCLEMADLLGWGDELRELMKTEHSRLDEMYPAKAKAQQAAKPKTVMPANAPAKERTSVTTKKSTPAVAAMGQGTPAVAAKGHGTPVVARRGSTPVAAKESSHPIKGRTSATPKAKPVGAAGQKGSKESVTSGTKLKATASAAQVRPSTGSPRKASTPSPRQSASKTSLSSPRPSRAAASTTDMRPSANGSLRNRLTPSPRLSASKESLSSPRPLKASASMAEVSPSADESPRNGLTPSPQLSASKESLSSPRPLKAAASMAEVSLSADESSRNRLTPSPRQSASQKSLSSPRPSTPSKR